MIVEHGVLGPNFRPAASVGDALTRAHADGGIAWVALQDEERLTELAEAAPTEWMAAVALLFVHFDDYDRMLHSIEDAVESLSDRLFPAPDDAVLEDTHRADQWVTRSGAGGQTARVRTGRGRRGRTASSPGRCGPVPHARSCCPSTPCAPGCC